MGNYGCSKRGDLPVDEAQKRVEAELAREGFGILARIDVREKLKDKLGPDFPPYVILGPATRLSPSGVWSWRASWGCSSPAT